MDPRLLRQSTALMIAGQLLYVIATLLHAGGEANNHPVIFATYAANGIWTAVHLGQFAAMTILLAGLFALFRALDAATARSGWLNRFGAAVAVAALALYAGLQAVDGVALKHAVDAWASAPEAEKGARFASAEAIRWLEWGMRSYQDFVMALTVLVLAVLVARAPGISGWIAAVIALSALAYFAQGWLSGVEGFTPRHSTAIVASWLLNLTWMIGLALWPPTGGAGTAVAVTAASARQ